MQRINGRVAIVTGASKGMGREIARQLAREGATVVLAARSEDALASLVDEIVGAGGIAVARAVDLREVSACRDLVERTAAEFGTLDILVNNAGLGHWASVEKMTVEQWRETMSVNVDAVFYLCQAAIPRMRATGGGHIVNIASVAGRRGAPNMAAYSASKAAVINFSEALGREVKDYGIKVSIVSPGVVDTEFRVSHAGRPMGPVLTDPELMLRSADVAAAVVAALKTSRWVSAIHTYVEPLG